MANRSKAQGTAFETWLVRYFQDAGLWARRLAEGGSNDVGDLELGAEDLWTIEAKARANLNAHAALAKAKHKAGTGPVALVWKRLTRKQGNQRRSPVGEPVIVAMDLETFTRLVRHD